MKRSNGFVKQKNSSAERWCGASIINNIHDGSLKSMATDPSSSDLQDSSFQADAISSVSNRDSEESVNKSEQEASVAPFSLSDQPTGDDKLGFEPYVQAIADFLTNVGTQPPLTLSIEGRWGSGKSSFMKQLQSEVSKKGAKTVWFNAWRYDKEESMLGAFALALTSELGRQEDFVHRITAYTRLQKSRFGWRKFVLLLMTKLLILFSVLSLAYYVFGHIDLYKVFAKDSILQISLGLGLPGTFLLGIAALRKVYKVTGNPLKIDMAKFTNNPRYEDRIPFIDRLHEDFERIVRCYAGDKRLFVFIDDLDRCDVPKSAEMMQALNLLLSDSLKVIYVVGLDRQKVAAGLAAKFKDLTPYLSHASPAPGKTDRGDALEFGFDYLEKFIQLPYRLPEPSTHGIQRFLQALNGKEIQEAQERPSEYKRLVVELKSDGPLVNQAATMVAPFFDNNPRRIKQFINMFRLRALLAGRTGMLTDNAAPSQLTFQQLAKLVAIELRWPVLLEDAEREPNLLHNLQQIIWSNDGKQYPDYVTYWLKQASSPAEIYWAAKLELMQLLGAGFKPKGISQEPLIGSEEEIGRYGLHDIDLRCFLRVSPIVQPRPSSIRPSDLPPVLPEDSHRSTPLQQSEPPKKSNSEQPTSEEIPSEELGGKRVARQVGMGGANPAQYSRWKRYPESAPEERSDVEDSKPR
jgi:hypothetical protein